MDYTIYDQYTDEYYYNEHREEERLLETAELNRRYILSYEKQYGCTFPEFILNASTEKEKTDLILWAASVRYLALSNESVYSSSNV